MQMENAIAALAALAQDTRLRIFRLLVRKGPDGASAGDIAKALQVNASTLSRHLNQLEQAGLLLSWRMQRQIFYAAHIEGMRNLLEFLTEDCCQGRPEICGDLLRNLAKCEPS